MNVSERDRSILKHIVEYCNQINMAIERFGDDFNVFDEDPVYRNAVSLLYCKLVNWLEF